ncbi:flagellar filament capping protein FliD [Robertmurraya andreesenii]|uniref:Flagellar hook-associated protein 2 n=1 Tax=Anoxybacillus andreesenii TaxID=1325932 RepID=A0ABT9V817_9BACL|nr:flagellar filament capping protein FliD [Robertmurraya andreesenii]MDQ0157102.1 flagellar hook-associated protein 2 [Robertmurraya andreesenii]
MVESIRFTGLASGLDTQSIVDSLMKVQRQPLDRLKQQQQVIEWQRDDYREMNKLLKSFDTYLFDNIYKQSKMLKKTVTTSNSELVSAVANAEAGNVSYKIENVKLATAARIQSTGSISTGGKLDPTKSLWSQKDKLSGLTWKKEDVSNSFTVPEGGGTDFQLTRGAISDINAQTGTSEQFITVTKADGSTENYKIVAKAATESDKPTGKEVYIDDNTGKMVFGESLAEGDTFSVEFKANYLDFNIETYNEDGSTNTRESSFKFSGTTSLNSVFNEINKSNVGINIFYDSGTDKVVTQRKATGELVKDGKSINFVGESASFFTGALKLDSSNEDNSSHGTDASFTINGLQTTRKSNTFTMNDVTFTLKKDSAGSTESSTISVKNDTDEIVKTIKEFVDKYNEMIGKINGELKEERYRTFTPLTDEQKAAMKEKEVEQWEEKARSGMLRRDTLLSSGLSKMRMDLYAEVVSNADTRTDKKYNQLSEIGIKTSKDYLDGGKLEIDEDKLREAIEDNPEAIYQLFMADGTASLNPNDKNTTPVLGIARRLRSSIAETMGKIEEKAGNTYKTEHNYSMGKDILRIKDNITRLEDRLKMVEQRYWNQYTAMEKAMQQLNSQSSQLLAQLGMGQK